MAERERRITPPYGGVFVARTQVLDADDVRRAVWRMAHEIIERNHGLDGVVLIGLQTGGVPSPRRWPRPSSRSTAPRPAARHARRRLPPRRHRPAAGAARGGDRHPRRPRPARSWSWSTTCCSPGAPSGPRSTRVHDLRPAPGRPAGGDGRPGPPRAAHPPRLRGQEPAHPARRDGQRHARRRRPGRGARRTATGDGRAAPPAGHRRPRGATASTRLLRPHRHLRGGQPAGIPKVPALRGSTVAWLFYEDSTRTRL